MSEAIQTVTVAGSALSAAKVRTYAAGSSITLAAPATLHGFPIPAKSVVHLDPQGNVVEADLKAAIKVGYVGIKKGGTLAKERGEWVVRGMIAAKFVLGGVTLTGGDPVRVRADGQLVTVFPSKPTKMGDATHPASTEFRWTGSAFAPVVEDLNYVPPAETDEDDDEDDLADDEADDVDDEADDEDDEDADEDDEDDA